MTLPGRERQRKPEKEASRIWSVSTARFVTPSLTKRKRELLEWLHERYVESVNLCLRKCLEHGLTSIGALHRAAYGEWKSEFGLATHWFHSAGHVAIQTLRAWRRLCHNGQADPAKPPVYEARTMRLELWDRNLPGICRFHGNAVQICVRRGEYLWLPLIVTEQHELRHLRDWREGRSKAGAPTISLLGDRASVSVPFKREVEGMSVMGVCGVDINERTIELCILKGDQKHFMKLDVSRLPAIRHASQLKRRSIQKKLDEPPRPLQKRRLRMKYWRREHNRTSQILHVVSKQIAQIAERERVAIAFEDITGIRGSMRSRRKSKDGKGMRRDMRRRLNQWPFRRLQSYVAYKALRKELPTVVVSNYCKSKDCPVCGRYNRPNGHSYRCQACGFEADRHVVASWNIAKYGARHVHADSWQMKQAAEEPVAPVKLPREPERFLPQESRT